MRISIFTFIFFNLFLPFSLVTFISAQKPGPKAIPDTAPDSLLIKNVYLISREDTAGDIKVNLLMVDKTLQIVTKDDIVFGPGTRTLDGKEGYLMGKMVIGEPPSFVILDENPRQDFDVLLNTNEHIRFAMNQGVIVLNKLSVIALSPAQLAKLKKNSWSAYQPPPLAVPLNYYSKRKWNKFDTKYISGLFNGVIAFDHLNWLSQDGNSKTQVGELESTSVGAVRAIRFGLVGTLNFKTPWVYTVFFTNNSFDRGYNGGEDNRLLLYDLRLDIPLPGGVNLSVGKQKEPVSMERLIPLMFLPMQERQAAADAFLPARNYGVLLNGTVFDSRGTFAAGIFKNVFDSDTTFAKTPTEFTWRVTGLPFISADESNLLHLGLAVRHSTADLPLVGKVDAEFFQAPAFIRTDDISADRLTTYVAEAYWRKGPWLLGSELMANNIQSAAFENPKPAGWNIFGSWVVTGEMRKYRRRSGIFDPVPVSKPVGQGGWGALELCTRYSSIDMTTKAISGGNMRTFSIGANWWLSPRAHFSGNFRYIGLNQADIKGYSSGMNFRLILILD